MTTEPTILMGVGATKAGTTWLYEYLASHPECHVRSIKELHYFDAVENDTFAAQKRVQRGVADKLRLRLLREDGKPAKRALRKLRDVMAWYGVLENRAASHVDYLAYLTAGREDIGLVADITPSYALLPETRLSEMASVSSDVRMIYLLRDPVARLWSHVRMVGRRAARTADAVPDTCYKLLDDVLDGATSGMTMRGDYAGTITRLKRAVDPSRLLVMFMEEMMTGAGLGRLCTFLGIGAEKADFSRRVHAGPVLAMSDDQTRRARALLRPQYEFVARHYPDLPANWRRNMGEGTL